MAPVHQDKPRHSTDRLISLSCARPYLGRLYILSEHIITLDGTFPAIQGWSESPYSKRTVSSLSLSLDSGHHLGTDFAVHRDRRDRGASVVLERQGAGEFDLEWHW